MDSAKRFSVRRWLSSARHPTRRDGVIAALLVLPWALGMGAGTSPTPGLRAWKLVRRRTGTPRCWRRSWPSSQNGLRSS